MLALLAAAACVSQARATWVWDDLMYADTNDEAHQILYSAGVTIDGRRTPTRYHTLMRSGDPDPAGSGEVWGQQFNRYGNIIYQVEEGNVTNIPQVSVYQDFSSLLQVGDRLFSVSQFEVGQPAISYLAELVQEDSGHLSIVSFIHMDWSAWEGLWTPCAGSVTPWMTHLAAEEFAPEAKDFSAVAGDTDVSNAIRAFMRWFDVYPPQDTFTVINETFNPYYYGYPWEATVYEDGSYYVTKHYSMGRTSAEVPFVMPDNRTVYTTDDGTNRFLAAYRADRPGDLTSGKLYAAKVFQESDVDGGVFRVSWIKLGRANDLEIQRLADRLRFDDIFDYLDGDVQAYPQRQGCPPGYTSINVVSDHECLKLRPGMRKAASRLEARRYAAMMGATTEFSKLEGFTYNPLANQAYMAASSVRYGMEDFNRRGVPNDRYDVGSNNDIRLPYNPCGCVYEMNVGSDWLLTDMYSLICGIPDDSTPGNTCAIDGIANPDNLAMVPEHDGLIIGEDTARHQNDIIWYYDLETLQLQRMMSAPYGSETTSPYYYPNINGWSYVVGVVQHPYGETDQDKLIEPQNTGEDGYFGYFGPLPADGQPPVFAPAPAPLAPAPAPFEPAPSPASPPAFEPAPFEEEDDDGDDDGNVDDDGESKGSFALAPDTASELVYAPQPAPVDAGYVYSNDYEYDEEEANGEYEDEYDDYHGYE